jgi:hypothetical protein
MICYIKTVHKEKTHKAKAQLQYVLYRPFVLESGKVDLTEKKQVQIVSL